MRKSLALAALAVSLFTVSSALAAPYKVVEVPNGGTITGKVTWTGAKKAKPDLKVTKDGAVCGKSKKDESLLVSADGGLQNAVVYLKGITAGKKPEKTAKVDQRSCRYVPHVQAAMKGAKLTVHNSDSTLHNVNAKLNERRTIFNLAMPMKDQKAKRKLKSPGLIHLGCDAGHTWMSAYIHVLSNPYYAVTAPTGASPSTRSRQAPTSSSSGTRAARRRASRSPSRPAAP